MSLWLVAAVLALGAALRLTRLITRDNIALPLRRALAGGRSGTFVTCPWCVGFWVTLVCVLASWWVAPLHGLPWWYTVPTQVAGTAWLVGMLSDLEPDE